MKISIDPGQSCGVCAWVNGRPVEIRTRYAYGATYPKRRSNLWDKLCCYFEELELRYNEEITAFSIEAFQQGYSKNIKQTRKLENLKGYLIHGLERWNRLDELPVYEIGKGTTPKGEAEMLARRLHLKGTEHAIDALHIGCLAGWLEEKK
jgi:hypothetical protein